MKPRGTRTWKWLARSWIGWPSWPWFGRDGLWNSDKSGGASATGDDAVRTTGPAPRVVGAPAAAAAALPASTPVAPAQ